METALAARPSMAIFSAGGQTALDWAPKFAEQGCFVIDNSSAWRMDPEVPLVIPEVNPESIIEGHRIIANPNCSTIQLLVALAPLHRKYGLERVVVSTYQSVTGTGVLAVEQLEREEREVASGELRVASGELRVASGESESRLAGNDPDLSGWEDAYPHQIYRNCLPQCDVFMENDYTREEMKLVNETRKILGDESIRLTATAVRVPVVGGHSEAVNIEFKKSFDINEVRLLLAQSPGIVVIDDPANLVYPMPVQAHEKDEVFVGRIRLDNSHEKALNLWVVSDNLRKGAATNAIQIAEYLIQAKFVG